MFNPAPNYPSDKEKENSVPAPSITETTKRKRQDDSVESDPEQNKRCHVDRRNVIILKSLTNYIKAERNCNKIFFFTYGYFKFYI